MDLSEEDEVEEANKTAKAQGDFRAHWEDLVVRSLGQGGVGEGDILGLS